MSKSRKVNRMVVTGGGTGGHVFPAVRIAKAFQRTGTDILYIGSIKGIERQVCRENEIKFRYVRTGKLRRYFSWQNFIDPLNIFIGFLQSYFVLRRYEPEVIFSKGGFVSLPVVFAGALLQIPVVLHESDITPGLANRIMIFFADKICLSFKESLEFIDNKKAVFTGNPIREDLFHGDAKKAKIVAGFEDSDDSLPVVLFLGGSLGSQKINKMVESSLSELTKFCRVILQTGKGKLIEVSDDISKINRFFQVEFVGVKALANLYKLSDLIVSRAGAGQITELAFLTKPSILIPLSLDASRGDQITNAKILSGAKATVVLDETDITKSRLISNIKRVLEKPRVNSSLKKNITKFYNKDSVRDIMKVIKTVKM